MVSFKMFAGTNIGLRDNNEDNFTVCPDLNKDEWIMPADYQQAIQLGSRGCVMVVADGMGGQNAGEVASAIAIETVQELFAPSHMPADILEKSNSIKSFLKRVISECDIRIKKRTELEPETDGMGSTLVLSWVLGGKIYVAWIGDSRAYSYVKGKGIARLTKDHSYVQQLVDAGAITEEEAMSHPNSNVITRSLGDSFQQAKADVAEYDVEDGQIILLCSDGLCGVCPDNEIGIVLEEESDDLQQCKERLTEMSLGAGGSDNITVALLALSIDSSETEEETFAMRKISSDRLNSILKYVIGICFVGIIVLLVLLIMRPNRFEKGIKISLAKNSLYPNESTKYHITICGDSTSTLDYDSELLDVNMVDSIISVKHPFLFEDKTTFIIAKCKNDPNIADTVELTIKKKIVNLPDNELPILNDPEYIVKAISAESSNTEDPGNNLNESLASSPGQVTSVSKNNKNNSEKNEEN